MHFGGFTGTTGQSLFVDSNVAAIAVFVRHGVADLALKVTQVLLVLGVFLSVGPYVRVAVFASAILRFRVLIPGGYRFPRTVEFLAVAFGTGHGLPGPVNISRDALILTEVLSANAGAVASNTVILHGGGLAELVPGNKAAAQLIRPADMTLTAGRVALLAVIFKGCGQRGTFFQVTSSGFKNGFKAAERCMEANLIHVGVIFVAGDAICLKRVGYQPHMSHFLFFITTVTTVADNTTDLTMSALDKLGILQEYLLPYLQRR